MIRAITSFGFVGLIPVAPGTFGSAAAVLAGYLLHRIGAFPLLGLATVALFFIGLWATTVFVDGAEIDPGEVVIDEVIGQWIALMPLSGGLWFAGVALNIFPWPGWVGAFVLFRAFDILKPWPVSWADQMKSPLGIMLDDVIAGALAAIVIAVAAAVAHG